MKKHLSITVFAAMLFCSCNDNGDLIIPGPQKPVPVTVFEYSPAPGQFINELPGFDGVITEEGAKEYAQKRLNSDTPQHVSLGAFGGYIVVGFGTGIRNSGKIDFSVTGNQFETSSEPGVVWVMQDANGNGLPDDTWYELRGSETGKESTVQDYEITYYRPDGETEDVKWTDNRDGQGVVPWNQFHTQPSYYPAWITADSYTLRGTLLETRIHKNEYGEWTNGFYEWGYADNFGSDRGSGDDRMKVCFSISNAVNPDGTPVRLEHIDFIKVQTAVNAHIGPLGEISTEVVGFDIENTKPR